MQGHNAPTSSLTQPQNEEQKHANTNSSEHLLPVNVAVCVFSFSVLQTEVCAKNELGRKKKNERKSVIQWLVSDRKMTHRLFNGFGFSRVFIKGKKNPSYFFNIE